MIEIVKRASNQGANAGNPVNILFGEVLSIDNLQVKVNQKLILPKDVLIIPESLTRYEIDLTHSHGEGSALDKIVIREGLKKGDKVLLIRVQGGQQFIIWDRVI